MQQEDYFVIEFIRRPADEPGNYSANYEIGEFTDDNKCDRNGCGLQINVRAQDLDP